jgi:hypothetical protein
MPPAPFLSSSPCVHLCYWDQLQRLFKPTKNIFDFLEFDFFLCRTAMSDDYVSIDFRSNNKKLFIRETKISDLLVK